MIMLLLLLRWYHTAVHIHIYIFWLKYYRCIIHIILYSSQKY